MSTLRTAFVSCGALAAILVEAIATCLWVDSCCQEFMSAAPALVVP